MEDTQMPPAKEESHPAQEVPALKPMVSAEALENSLTRACLL